MIEINNLTTNPINEEFLRKIGQIVLEEEKKKSADLSIVFVGAGRMRELNKKYRGKNRVTDVLAFPESQVLLEKFKIKGLKETSGLGEIVICLREIKKNTKRFGGSFEKELARVLIHGILHLLGYNHEVREKEAKRMEEKENYYLSMIFQKERGFTIFLLNFLFIAILIIILIISFAENKEILTTLFTVLRSILIK